MININNLRNFYKNRHKLKDFELDIVYIIKKNIILYGNGIITFNGEKIEYKDKFDLSNTTENILSKIYNFYILIWELNYNKKEFKLYSLLLKDGIISWGGSRNEEDFYYINNFNENYNKYDDKINFGYYLSDYLNEELEENELEKEWELTLQEFFLLMQIYFGLYQNEELKKELEENEKNGKYYEIRKNLDYKKFCEENYEYVEKYNKELSELRKSKQDWTIGKTIKIEDYFIEKELSKPEVKEYLELELIRKDTTGAFGGLKIEKIYDKNWSEEKQKERIDEINKEFGEEVVVEG